MAIVYVPVPAYEESMVDELSSLQVPVLVQTSSLPSVQFSVSLVPAWVVDPSLQVPLTEPLGIRYTYVPLALSEASSTTTDVSRPVPLATCQVPLASRL